MQGNRYLWLLSQCVQHGFGGENVKRIFSVRYIGAGVGNKVLAKKIIHGERADEAAGALHIHRMNIQQVKQNLIFCEILRRQQRE